MNGAPAFSFGSDCWPALAKLAEECGEVVQVVGKLVQTGGNVDHWDGSNLADRLTEELGDLLAAIDCTITMSPHINPVAVAARRDAKVTLFWRWRAEVRADRSLDPSAGAATDGSQP